MNNNDNTQVAQRAPQSVRDYLAAPAYKARFIEVLGNRAPQFMASLIQLTNDPNLAKCEPKSVIAAAMIAAVLDFPIEKSLGFAHIVPYAGVAQFQMAAKGYVQLALRSGQYQRLNAKPVNAEAFGGYDEVGEPLIDWSKLDDTEPTIGYVVAWKLINGFIKVAYWPRSKVESHAAKFSQAYKKKKADSPWFTNFDAMALKTVVMNELRAWGVLSVQMQKAMVHDMGVHTDIGAEPQYIDNEADPTPTSNRPKTKGLAGMKQAEKVEPEQAQTATEKPEGAGAPPKTDVAAEVKQEAKDMGFPAEAAAVLGEAAAANAAADADLFPAATPPKVKRCEVVALAEQDAKKADGKLGKVTVVQLKGEYEGNAYYNDKADGLPGKGSLVDVVLTEKDSKIGRVNILESFALVG